jgi:ABC-type sugar transport system substrate-binding protein
MVRPVARRGWRWAWIVLALVGCEAGPTTSPPPPPTSPLEIEEAAGGDSEGASAANAAKELVLVLPAGDHQFAPAWEHYARQEAATVYHALLTAERPEAADPPGRQAELIRRAAGRAPSALLVLPGDPKALAPALEEVRGRRVPIVLLEHPVPVAGKPLTLVAYEPFRGPARALAAAAVEEIKTAGFPPEAPAAIVHQLPGDEASRARVAALQEALKGAGIKSVDVIPYDTATTNAQRGDEARKALKEALGRRELALVVADGDQAISEVSSQRHLLGTGRRFVAMGVAATKASQDYLGFGQFVGMIDLNVMALPKAAVAAALDLAAGRAVPEKTELPTPFRRATGPSRITPPPAEMLRLMTPDPPPNVPKPEP